MHCTWLPDARDLGDALTQLNPEMLIAFIDELGIDLASIMKVKQQTAPEMPVLIVRENVDEAAIAEAMRLGAQDVVTLANRSRLQAVVDAGSCAPIGWSAPCRPRSPRRASTASSCRTFSKARPMPSRTCRKASSSTPTARGWSCSATPGDDALTGTPLMDLFEQETHPALKGALVACLQGKWTRSWTEGSGAALRRLEPAAELTLTRADYENEPAMRISIPARNKEDRDLEVQLADAVKNDATTRFLQQRYLIAAVRERCAQPMKGGVRQFAYVKPDRFLEIQNAIGVLASEDFMAQLAELLRIAADAHRICAAASAATASWSCSSAAPSATSRPGPRTSSSASTSTRSCSTRRIYRLRSPSASGCCRPPTPTSRRAITDAVNATRRGRELGGNQMYAVDKADTDTRVQAYDKIWVKHIKSALMENRFRLVQQPIASLLGEDKGMFDVLVRMLDEQGNEVLPAEFIAAAERNDLMKNIDRWVIGASMSFAANRKADLHFRARVEGHHARQEPGGLARDPAQIAQDRAEAPVHSGHRGVGDTVRAADQGADREPAQARLSLRDRALRYRPRPAETARRHRR